jgi:hypothetical protein
VSSTWNYRVVKRKHDRGQFEEEYDCVIKEVYYNDDDTIFAMSKEPDAAYGESPTELKRDLKMMLEAFDLPVLNEWEVVFIDKDPICGCMKADCEACKVWTHPEDDDDATS